MDETKFRTQMMRVLNGNRTIVKSVSRNMAAQQGVNGPKVEASKSIVSALASAAAELSTEGSTVHGDAQDGDQANRNSTPTMDGQESVPMELNIDGDAQDGDEGSRNNSLTMGTHEAAPTELNVVRTAKPQLETQGGGKGSGAQTGKIRVVKPNDGRLHEKKRKARESSSEYRPSDQSSADESTEQQQPKRPVAKKSRSKSTTRGLDSDTDSDDGDSESAGDIDSDADDGGDSEDEEDDVADEVADDDEEAKAVESSDGSEESSADDTCQEAVINGDGLKELPPNYRDIKEKIVHSESEPDTSDGGDVHDIVTHLRYAESGTIVDSDEADESYVDESDLGDDDPRKPHTISKRAKYHKAMKDQSMRAFSRIRRFDPHEKGCYLTLGNPPNIFDFSETLRMNAQKQAREVFHSQQPFSGKGREVKFKEKVWISAKGCRVHPRFSAKGAAVADCMHVYSQYALTGLLKTAPLGSTFFEMVNQVSMKKALSPSMMLRSQVEPYRTIFTCALSYAKDLHYRYLEDEMKKKPSTSKHEAVPSVSMKVQRMAVLEMIVRTKSICKSRVNCHKVDDDGVKVELAKRKQRSENKRNIDFD